MKNNRSKRDFLRAICALALVCTNISMLNHGRSQYNFVHRDLFTPKIDTLFSSHRSGGQAIDSLDKAYYDLFPTLFNVGRGYLPFFQNMRNWGNYRHFFSDERPTYRAGYHFTALPYTGFYYSFGSGGEQVLDLRYTQNVGQNFNLSFRYHRSVSDPIRNAFLMRGIETEANDLSLNLHFHKNRLNSFLSTYYSFDNYRENFGIDPNNPNLNAFPLAQIPVNNTIANVRIRRMQINLRNEYDLSRDSSGTLLFVSSMGMHNFQRRYKDSLSLGVFDFWVYDSMNTTDTWEEPHILIEHGFQVKQKHWKAYAGFHLDYFTYFNRGIRSTRFDGIIQGAFEVKKDNLFLESNLRLFVFGTPGEYLFNTKLRYALSERWNIGAEALHERIFPEFFQLQFLGNHITYDNSSQNISPTVRTYLESFITYGQNSQLRISAAYINVSNLYTFISPNWDFNGNQNIVSPALSWRLRKSVFGWNGKAQYFIGQKDALFAPDYLISTRMFFDGALFAAKKLKAATGFEVHYFEGYSTLGYHPEIGVFGQISSASNTVQQNFILNYFINLQMDRFRFFVAANRINTLFERQVGGLVENYPLRPFFIRMGIVWDFLN